MRAPAAALALIAVLALGGCGGDGGGRPELIVSAAASLKNAFTRYADRFPEARVRYSFAGSDELAAQIRQGARPDVFAAANTELPKQLSDEGLVGHPAVFAANRLVLATPANARRVREVEDLERPGVKLVMGAASVPAGSYTREVLRRLGKTASERILANVRSNEPDVAGVVGKLAQGAADAGFVYVTDVRAAGGRLRAVELPARLQPSVSYAAAVVTKGKHPQQAKAFVAGLLGGPGQSSLRQAGFEPPPR
jgi:molybdate transport system substrate-binding protein